MENAEKLALYIQEGRIDEAMSLISQLKNSGNQLHFNLQQKQRNSKAEIISQLVEDYNIEERLAVQAAEKFTSVQGALDYVLKT